jgi:hypothetical protein
MLSSALSVGPGAGIAIGMMLYNYFSSRVCIEK